MKKAVVITGASSGIGAATAIQFGRNGYFVYLMGRNKDRLAEVAVQCRAGASLMSCDLTDVPALNKRIGEITSTTIHKVEVLVNNAGIFDVHSTEEGSDELWQKEFEVNLMSAVRLTRAFFPYFKQHGGGSIINVSSSLGLKPTAATSAYSAMKAAMINMTQSNSLEGGAFNIRVNCVAPGIVDTPIHSFHALEESKRQEAIATMNPMQPLGRIGTAEEIAKAIYFLGSPESSWTTGATLAIDGGITNA
ncbi:SDR family oxidoreductase [Bdellovibrio sp. SKB1291214]|uniref:SDR family NAD(P)-dependent oxidoreductase n=1 Tax=Bdellovibrio sp. SKB1291214 TaxID=1732569 RepID=UPI000B51A6BA|nr:SDR family oxidoreductase [Bdellovibrio sp. SKB1291214]UYL08108.1 SDR family oxidoreductase [Bdellovibrio sp. SKB1291214]